MPFRAISIIPLERVTPIKIPTEAAIKAFRKVVTFDPMALFRKLTASFATPTVKSMIESTIVTTRKINAISNFV